MRILSRSFACPHQPAQQRTDDLAWARAFVASPAATPHDARHRMIVADLVAQLGGVR